MVSLQALNKLLQTGNAEFIDSNDFDASYFTDYEQEYNFIMSHYKKYKTMPDKETVLDKFPKFSIIEVNETDEYLADKLREQYAYTKSVPVLNKAIEMYSKDSFGAIDYILTNLKDIQPKTKSRGIDIVQESQARLEVLKDKSENHANWFMSSGFPELDIITGGIQRGEELIAIFARLNNGKSWCSLKIATAAWEQGFNVGYFSPEMSDINIAYRFDTLYNNFSNRSLKTGDKAIIPEFEKYTKQLAKHQNKFLVTTVSDFITRPTVSKLRKWVVDNSLDMLVIDGITFVADERGYRNQSVTTAIQHISEDLMTMSVELKIPVIAVIQANRESNKGDNEAPELENIRDSDGLGQAASMALSIRNKNGMLEMNIKKNRNGSVGNKLLYAWDIDVGSYKYVPNSKDGLPTEVAEKIEQEQKEMFSEDTGIVF
jgi:replicative DNA helicase